MTLYHGDSAIVLAEMPADRIDLIVTSPPYDSLRSYMGFTFDFETIARELYRVTKPGGVVVWVVGDATVNGSETGTSFRQALYFKDMCGFNLHDTMIYGKHNWVPLTHNRYEQQFEYMFILSKGNLANFNPIKMKCIHRGRENPKGTFRHTGQESQPAHLHNAVSEEKIRGNIFMYDVGAGKSTTDDYAFVHPASFPEALARDHILSWSNPGDTVLDPFLGSGTTLKMASLLDRKGIGIDCSADYLDIARKRIASAQQQTRFVL